MVSDIWSARARIHHPPLLQAHPPPPPTWSSSSRVSFPEWQQLWQPFAKEPAGLPIISTEGALRRPMTYDDHPIHPSTPIPTFQNAEIGPQEKAPRRWSAFNYGASLGE